MVAPKWLDNRIQPIAIDDVVHYLVGAGSLPPEVNRTFDIGGPEVLTYREMIARFADATGSAPAARRHRAGADAAPREPLGRARHPDLGRAGQAARRQPRPRGRRQGERPAGPRRRARAASPTSTPPSVGDAHRQARHRDAQPRPDAVQRRSRAPSWARLPPNRTRRWYRSLDLPDWQPPPLAFPIVWTALYADIAASSATALNAYDEAGDTEGRNAYLKAFGTNLALNAAWSVLFWRVRKPVGGRRRGGAAHRELGRPRPPCGHRSARAPGSPCRRMPCGAASRPRSRPRSPAATADGGSIQAYCLIAFCVIADASRSVQSAERSTRVRLPRGATTVADASGADRLLREGAAVGDRRDADLALEVVAQHGCRREAALAGDALDVEVGRLEQVARTAARAGSSATCAESCRPRREPPGEGALGHRRPPGERWDRVLLVEPLETHSMTSCEAFARLRTGRASRRTGAGRRSGAAGRPSGARCGSRPPSRARCARGAGTRRCRRRCRARQDRAVLHVEHVEVDAGARVLLGEPSGIPPVGRALRGRRAGPRPRAGRRRSRPRARARRFAALSRRMSSTPGRRAVDGARRG